MQSGNLRALAVVGPANVAAIPNVKTFKELGVDGMEVANSWYAVVAPAGTPHEIIRTLNAALTKILEMPATMDAIRAMGLEPATSTPEEMTESWARELKRLGTIVKKINIGPQ